MPFLPPNQQRQSTERSKALNANRERRWVDCCVDIVACGSLSDDDILVLPFDVTDIAFHSTATDTILKTFGQVYFIVSTYVFLFFL